MADISRQYQHAWDKAVTQAQRKKIEKDAQLARVVIRTEHLCANCEVMIRQVGSHFCSNCGAA